MIAALAEQPGLTDRVYSALKEAIFSLELEPGTPLVERDLAERFGVSKSPVRDALQRLVGEGLVTQTPYRGMRVRLVDPDEADEFYGLHATLEELSVRLATPRLTADDIAEMRGALERAPAAIAQRDISTLAHINHAFHMVFVRRSGNRVLAETFANFHGRARVLNAIGFRWFDGLKIELDHHEAILEAAAAGDAELAAKRMRDHVEHFRGQFRTGWETNAAQKPASDGAGRSVEGRRTPKRAGGTRSTSR